MERNIGESEMKKRGKEGYVGEKGGKESMMTESKDIIGIKKREMRKRIKKRKGEKKEDRGRGGNWDLK